MARARNPKRDEAFQLYADAEGEIKLKDIAEQIGVPDLRIRKWKSEDKWDAKIKERSDSNSGTFLLDNRNVPNEKPKEEKKKRGAQPGNQNAVGNDGGAPIGNKNALITGKYERIFKDCLDEEEQAACAELDTDELAQINLELELLTVRERRMMRRIQEYAKKKDDIEERITQVVGVSTLQNAVYDEMTGQMKDSSVTTLIPKELVQMKRSTLDKLLKIEHHLTDIQAKKTKAIETKHRIVLARQEVGGNTKEDPFDELSVDELRALINEDD